MTPEDLIAGLPPLGGVLIDAFAEGAREGFQRSSDIYGHAALAVAKVVVEHVLRELEKQEPQSPSNLIPWDGGACPVGMNTRVDVKYRGQGTSRYHADDYTESGLAAREYRWEQTDSDGDIVAYRVRSEE